MRGTSFVFGLAAGMASAAVAAIALEERMSGTQTGYTVSKAAHQTAGAVDNAADAAADAVDRMMR